jgi:hypothetical protein
MPSDDFSPSAKLALVRYIRATRSNGEIFASADVRPFTTGSLFAGFFRHSSMPLRVEFQHTGKS